MSFFSGIVDQFEHIRLGGYPQPFQRMLGLEVVDWLPLADGETVKLKFADGIQSHGDVWSELITLSGAEPLANLSLDRKSTRLNSSHQIISYAVFCLKKKKRP